VENDLIAGFRAFRRVAGVVCELISSGSAGVGASVGGVATKTFVVGAAVLGCAVSGAVVGAVAGAAVRPRVVARVAVGAVVSPAVVAEVVPSGEGPGVG